MGHGDGGQDRHGVPVTVPSTTPPDHAPFQHIAPMPGKGQALHVQYTGTNWGLSTQLLCMMWPIERRYKQ
jgi:hypothetical protein